MAYKVKLGNKDYFSEEFPTETEAKKAKYFAIVGAKTFRSASKSMDTKIVKVVKKKK
jgi:hypothetical protein